MMGLLVRRSIKAGLLLLLLLPQAHHSAEIPLAPLPPLLLALVFCLRSQPCVLLHQLQLPLVLVHLELHERGEHRRLHHALRPTMLHPDRRQVLHFRRRCRAHSGLLDQALISR